MRGQKKKQLNNLRGITMTILIFDYFVKPKSIITYKNIRYRVCHCQKSLYGENYMTAVRQIY